MSIRVLLADDHNMIRQGLRALIEKEDGMSVIAEAEDGRKAVETVRELAPDVVVMDVGMPNMNGIEATRRIVSGFPGVKVLALFMHSDNQAGKSVAPHSRFDANAAAGRYLPPAATPEVCAEAPSL